MENKYGGEDRRKSNRLDVAFTLIYSVEKPLSLRIHLGVADDINAFMVNLSDLGMALVTSQDIPLLAQLYIKFDLIDLRLEGEERRQHIEMTGEVVSNVICADGSYRLGIRFDNLSDHDKIMLNNFVKRNSLPGS